ncbi:hypothetical protein [Tahibacter amnicola]|uniref:Uncharacterized protein n=1 Tax=Tahibacter amnicola TaxID=2976241 RepID=A0ABY6BDN8_9GAMM|nr:hypothetical protein [Tahibacter amnicola]UXI67348.1 hypothetical protein N4264_21825 [Tahibacter amnicola]
MSGAMGPATVQAFEARGSEVVVSSDDPVDATAFRDALAAAVATADYLELTEHANMFDLDPMSRLEGVDPPVYAVRRFTGAHRDAFLANVRQLPEEGGAEPMCLFSPHHTLDFFEGGRRVSAMEICFSCAQLRWSANGSRRPDGLVALLRELTEANGLSVARDWRKAAARRLPMDKPKMELAPR